jgi:hypothetical protein
MKKLFLSLAFLSAGAGLFAQGLTSKKGTPILPEAKDWSISFDAVPFLDYAFDKTRIFSNTAPNSAAGALDYQTPFTIVGKYMKDENTAYRVKARVGFNSFTDKTYVPKTGTSTGETVENSETTSDFALTLGAGLQYYRGKGRLRGFYGAEGIIDISKDPSKSFTYGNSLGLGNTTPRVLEDSKGLTFGIGARGFVGAEYFFAPKMSVGAEFGWGIGFSTTGEGTAESESWNGTSVVKTTNKTAGGSNFNIDVDNASGAITFAIYF